MNWIKGVSRTLKWFAWGVAMLVLLAAVVWIVFDILGGIKLRRAIAAWQDAGLTMDIRDLAPPPVPPEENAAVVLGRVIDLREPNPFEHRLRDQRTLDAEREAIELAERVLDQMENSAISPELVEALASALEKPAIAYRLHTVREAVGYDRFDVYPEYELGPELAVPHIGQIRSLAQLTHAEAIFHAASGNWTEANDSLAVALRLGDLLGDEIFLISRITNMAIRQLTFEIAGRFFRIHTPDTATIERWRILLNEMRPPNFEEAFVLGNIAESIWVYRKLEDGDFNVSEFTDRRGFGVWLGWRWLYELYLRKWVDGTPFRPMHKADVAMLLNTIRERIEIIEADGEDGPDWQELREWDQRILDGLPRYAVVTQLFHGNGWMIFRAKDASVARLELARVALAANAYRAAEDDWPESLSTLVPEYLAEVPRDPFGGGPLSYLRTEKRVAVYSIGPNLHDDGALVVDRIDREPGDIVWVLEAMESD